MASLEQNENDYICHFKSEQTQFIVFTHTQTDGLTISVSDGWRIWAQSPFDPSSFNPLRKSLQNNRVSCRLNTEDDTMTVSFLETLTNVVLQLASPDSQKSLNKYLIFSLLKRQESLRKREPIPSELIGSNTSAIADDLCKVKKPRIDKKPLKAPGRSMVNPGSRKITTKRGVNFDDD